jgi:predicted GNAT family acetyltransferase
MNLTFKPFTAAELNERVVDKTKFPVSTNRHAFADGADYYAALDKQGQPVGVLAFRKFGASANIECIETAVYHRNEGIAPKLTQAFLLHAKAEGLTVATSNVDPSKDSFLKRLMAKTAASVATEVSR